MTFRGILLFRLFVASYAPLALIFAIRESDSLLPLQEGFSFWLPAVIAGMGLADAYRLPRGMLGKGTIQVALFDVRDQSGQVAAYIATYLLPFLGIDLSGWRDGLAVLAYFIILFVVFVRSDLPLVNPAMYVTGWRVVSATRLSEYPGEGKQQERVLMLVPRDVPVSDGDIRVVRLGNFLVYADQKDGEDHAC